MMLIPPHRFVFSRLVTFRRCLSYYSSQKIPYYHLTGRSILSIQGSSAKTFLQGLITSDINRISSTYGGIYSAFLTAKGRVIADVFIHPNRQVDSFFVECDSRILDYLLKHLKKYILRSKIRVEDVSQNYCVISTPFSSQMKPGDILSYLRKTALFESAFWSLDLRSDETLSVRYLIPKGSLPIANETFRQSDPNNYLAKRLLAGIPEGTDDIVPEQSLPLEANLDITRGVDFDKGCYVGQELTIRTHHTGVVRKRIVPVLLSYSEDRFSDDLDQSFSPEIIDRRLSVFTAETQTVAKSQHLCSTHHNLGLAFIRLNQMNSSSIFTVATASSSTLFVKPIIPNWWPKDILANI